MVCFTSFSSEQEILHHYESAYPHDFIGEVQKVIPASIREIWRRSEQDLYFYENIPNNKSTNNDSCTSVRDPPPAYNSSCELVRKECKNKIQLFDYLSFVVCSLQKVQVGNLLYTC